MERPDFEIFGVWIGDEVILLANQHNLALEFFGRDWILGIKETIKREMSNRPGIAVVVNIIPGARKVLRFFSGKNRIGKFRIVVLRL